MRRDQEVIARCRIETSLPLEDEFSWAEAISVRLLAELLLAGLLPPKKCPHFQAESQRGPGGGASNSNFEPKQLT